MNHNTDVSDIIKLYRTINLSINHTLTTNHMGILNHLSQLSILKHNADISYHDDINIHITNMIDGLQQLSATHSELLGRYFARHNLPIDAVDGILSLHCSSQDPNDSALSSISTINNTSNDSLFTSAFEFQDDGVSTSSTSSTSSLPM